ncbi:hypothetical protein OG866_05810 [Streptomyces sp. NBC_00663]|uniref:hypothetical protein n=1 Tax=Streptomyces sp. NBC_00663 TaxID=2975801 RepID=UPI002E3104E1|nr:hypothetical protein [Streptomyces sp. NBC_00663]
MFRRSAVALAVVGALAVAGCGAEGSGGSAADPSRVTVDTATPTPSPTPTPVTSSGQQLVAMNISGGFAGVSQQVVLRGDGTVHARDSSRSAVRRASGAEFEELRTLLGDPALDEVPDVTVNTGAADLFRYELRFDGRTVTTDRSTRHPALDHLIDALSEFLPKG